MEQLKKMGEAEQGLRVAVVCDGPALQHWQVQCLQEMQRVETVFLVVFIVLEPVYTWATNEKTSPDDSICTETAFSHISPLTCRVMSGGDTHCLVAPQDIERLSALNLDILLNLSEHNLTGDILAVARYGCWVFCSEEFAGFRRGFSGLQEILTGSQVTHSCLVRLTADGAQAIVLRRGTLKTCHTSLQKQRESLYAEWMRWPRQACIDILNSVAPSNEARGSWRLLQAAGLSLRNRLRLFYRIGMAYFRQGFNKLFRHSEWAIGVVRAPIWKFLDPQVPSDLIYIEKPRAGVFLADPFGVVQNGRLTILCEEFDWQAHVGRIASIVLDEEFRELAHQVVFQEPFHMSYPYLLRDNGQLYCIPETGQAREISLFEGTVFPTHWQKVATLASGVAALDTTVFQYNGLWWMMFTDAARGSTHNLFIQYAETLTGPWFPHANNPVKTDVRSTRPAGTPFTHEGVLYRPAQDCSETYGGRLVINRLTRLTPTTFEEEIARVIEPRRWGRYPHGMHTLSAVGEMTLVDFKRFGFNVLACQHVVARLLRKCQRLLGAKRKRQAGLTSVNGMKRTL